VLIGNRYRSGATSLSSDTDAINVGLLVGLPPLPSAFLPCVLTFRRYALRPMGKGLTPNSPPPTDVQRGWDRCRLEEERILGTDLNALQDEFKDSLTFGPILSSDSSSGSDHLIGADYRQFVRTLRNADSLESKLRLLAMWLRQERILQPREFLPKKIRKSLIESTLGAFEKPKRRVLAVKPSELLYALVAEAWKPYFQLMHAKYKGLTSRQQSDPERGLAQLGFDATAVQSVLGLTKTLTSPTLRSATEAACRFAAGHLNVGDDTVLVAHAKVYPTHR
jgi:hypothetical protein